VTVPVIFRFIMKNVSMYHVHPITNVFGSQQTPLKLCLLNLIASILFGLLQHSNSKVCLPDLLLCSVSRLIIFYYLNVSFLSCSVNVLPLFDGAVQRLLRCVEQQ